VLLATLPVLAAPSISPQAALQQSKLAIQRHEYKEAEDTLKPLLDQFPTEDGLIEAHRLLTSSYFFQKKIVEARQEVIALLRLRPEYKLDPVVDPPVLVSFFEEIRKDQAERLIEIKKRHEEENERLRREEERKRVEERAKAQRIFVLKEVHKNSRWVAMVPFGVGQWQNGERKLAIALGTTEALLGAASLSLWITLQVRYPSGLVPNNEAQLVNYLNGFQIGLGAAFWGTVIIGIIEAQARFVPEVVHTRELPSKPKQTSWNLLPLLSPTTVGLGVQGAF
jgi:hypothetical protein